VSMVGGVLVAVVALLAGVGGSGALWLGAGGAFFTLVSVIVVALWSVPRNQALLEVRFPASAPSPMDEDAPQA
jgi:uncharacterized membrane protein